MTVLNLNNADKLYYGATEVQKLYKGSQLLYFKLTDPYFDNVVLYLKGDGENNSTNIVDSSPVTKTITRFGNTKISTVQSKYGGSSIYFDGSGDYLQIANSADIDFPSDFTIEYWANLEGTTLYYPPHFSLRTANNNAGRKVQVFYGDVGFGYKLDYRFSSISSNFNSTYNQSAHNGNWVHFAISRSGSTAKAFVNGIQDFSTTYSESISGAFLTIGQSQTEFGSIYFKGYIDSFRITKGVARYTANFDPETETYLVY